MENITSILPSLAKLSAQQVTRYNTTFRNGAYKLTFAWKTYAPHFSTNTFLLLLNEDELTAENRITENFHKIKLIENFLNKIDKSIYFLENNEDKLMMSFLVKYKININKKLFQIKSELGFLIFLSQFKQNPENFLWIEHWFRGIKTPMEIGEKIFREFSRDIYKHDYVFFALVEICHHVFLKNVVEFFELPKELINLMQPAKLENKENLKLIKKIIFEQINKLKFERNPFKASYSNDMILNHILFLVENRWNMFYEGGEYEDISNIIIGGEKIPLFQKLILSRLSETDILKLINTELPNFATIFETPRLFFFLCCEVLIKYDDFELFKKIFLVLNKNRSFNSEYINYMLNSFALEEKLALFLLINKEYQSKFFEFLVEELKTELNWLFESAEAHPAFHDKIGKILALSTFFVGYPLTSFIWEKISFETKMLAISSLVEYKHPLACSSLPTLKLFIKELSVDSENLDLINQLIKTFLREEIKLTKLGTVTSVEFLEWLFLDYLNQDENQLFSFLTNRQSVIDLEGADREEIQSFYVALKWLENTLTNSHFLEFILSLCPLVLLDSFDFSFRPEINDYINHFVIPVENKLKLLNGNELQELKAIDSHGQLEILNLNNFIKFSFFHFVCQLKIIAAKFLWQQADIETRNYLLNQIINFLFNPTGINSFLEVNRIDQSNLELLFSPPMREFLAELLRQIFDRESFQQLIAHGLIEMDKKDNINVLEEDIDKQALIQALDLDHPPENLMNENFSTFFSYRTSAQTVADISKIEEDTAQLRI